MGHVIPCARVRGPSLRASQPLGADEGPVDGAGLGILVGPEDERAEGSMVGLGKARGSSLGAVLGAPLGDALRTLGNPVGPLVSDTFRTALGDSLGLPLGLTLGPSLGDALGPLLGDELGTTEGDELGLLLGEAL
jgi:hypothetical protein